MVMLQSSRALETAPSCPVVWDYHEGCREMGDPGIARKAQCSPLSWLRRSRAMHAVRCRLPAKSSRSRCAQSVERADDARPIVSRRKRMRERRLGTPAGTVRRRDDTRPDTIGEVVDGRLDPRLHALACQMIAAEDDVDRLAPERTQGAERCIDDACVRARREHTDAAATHARREESLVED